MDNPSYVGKLENTLNCSEQLSDDLGAHYCYADHNHLDVNVYDSVPQLDQETQF